MKHIASRYIEYHERILRWQESFGQFIDTPGQVENQRKYAASEWGELFKSYMECDIKERADGVGDVLFTVLGMPRKRVEFDIEFANVGILGVIQYICLANNWDQFDILERVCRSNDTKFWETVDEVDLGTCFYKPAGNGKFVVRRLSDNKVVKPKTFVPPDFSDIVNGTHVSSILARTAAPQA